MKPFVCIHAPETSVLVGEAFLLQSGDRQFHVPNPRLDKQLVAGKPAARYLAAGGGCRRLAALVERLPGYRLPADHWSEVAAKLARTCAPEAVQRRIDDLREDEARRLFFDPILFRAQNRSRRQAEMTSFFAPDR